MDSLVTVTTISHSNLSGRGVNTVNQSWMATGRLLEKYGVEGLKSGGGGEYATQDGFGWTNGLQALCSNDIGSVNPQP